jgi:hypothetical protein
VPPEAAERVTVCADATDATLAVKLALVAPDATVSDDGTETAALLLERFTASPAAGAGPVRLTLHASEPDPVNEALLHVRAANVAGAIPTALRLTAILPDDELDPIDSTAEYVLACAGVNDRTSGADWPGFRVSGVEIPLAENEDPVIERPAIVTGSVPVEESVMVCVAVCPTSTFPKLTVAELTVRAGIAAFSVKAKFADWLLEAAEMFAV